MTRVNISLVCLGNPPSMCQSFTAKLAGTHNVPIMVDGDFWKVLAHQETALN